MKKKRTAILWLALVLALALSFSGCGEEEQPSTGGGGGKIDTKKGEVKATIIETYDTGNKVAEPQYRILYKVDVSSGNVAALQTEMSLILFDKDGNTIMEEPIGTIGEIYPGGTIAAGYVKYPKNAQVASCELVARGTIVGVGDATLDKNPKITTSGGKIASEGKTVDYEVTVNNPDGVTVNGWVTVIFYDKDNNFKNFRLKRVQMDGETTKKVKESYDDEEGIGSAQEFIFTTNGGR